MKLAAACYLANQDVIGYPIEHVIPSLTFADEVHLIAGDTPSFDAFNEVFKKGLYMKDGCEKLTLRAVEQPITSVGGIPEFMERVVNLVRTQSDADFIAICQADTVITPESAACSRAWMKWENLEKGTHTYVRIGFLYQNSQTGWGHTLVGRDFKGSFFGDGSGRQEGGHAMDFIGDINTTSLEIGSLSVDHYYRHQKNHHVLWNEKWLMGDRLAAYERGDREEFIRLSLHDARHRIRNAPLEPVEAVDPRFTEVINRMGLRAECDEVCALVKKFGYDR